MANTHPTPHGEKLTALSRNPKLPDTDKTRVAQALKNYQDWIGKLDGAKGTPPEILETMVNATNVYKKYIELDLIFNSQEDFLYRQKGQLKLDNTILEEFLPWLVDEGLVPGVRHVDGLISGPNKCFSGLYIGPLKAALNAGGIFVKKKDQDFTVGKTLFLRASNKKEFDQEQDFQQKLSIAFFVAELKTNLDKTMFQEAAATAQELKTNVIDAQYFLICEWLDMPPIDTRSTAIDEVLVLRRAKRLNSGVRANFSTVAGRTANRADFEKHLVDNPLSIECFRRIVSKLNEAFPDDITTAEEDIVKRGYF